MLRLRTLCSRYPVVRNLNVALLASLALAAACALAHDEWPQFRGPDGQGHATAKNLPTEWSETENVAWKTPIEGLGWSSPAISDSQIWITTALEGGKSLRAVCLDVKSGRVVHNVEVFQLENPGSVHSKNSHASPTPVIDGDRVFVHYGAHGTACLSTDGKVIWKTNELKYKHGHGPAGSPIVYGDLLILSCDGTDVQYVVALEKNTGKIRWKTDRDGLMAYSTPLIVPVAGKDQVVSVGGKQVVAYEPKTGKEIWRVRYGEGYSNVCRPVFGSGLVFVSSGYDVPELLAIRPDGQGDVTDSHVAWTLKPGAPLNPSPLSIGDELYVLSDGGIMTCLDAKTGETHWKDRVGTKYSASPLLADGHIYLLDEEGTCTVINPSTKELEKVAESKLPGRTLASIAVADGALFLRTDAAVYRLEKKSK